MSSKCNNFASEEALKIAKTNVEKYYAVVGILERWQDSLQLLEVVHVYDNIIILSYFIQHLSSYILQKSVSKLEQ